MDQEIRNKLRNVVTQCRRLLEDDTRDALEGKFGIFCKKDLVTADPNARMSHLSDEEQSARKDILDHFGHIQARGFKPKDALDQLIREISFTHLNRLCAYKMMEAREVYVGGQKFRESVSRGVNSNGVKFYLAEHEEDERLFNTGQQDVAYRHFLDWLGGALSEEIGVLFNPNDPANRLYPRQKTLDEVLDLLNGGGIKAEETELREQWPQIWSQDETIGWVYQYFTPKELRDAARDPKKGGSQAPRNSYELAFRNQFFTPRYVVEFLTDNTLGRIWYEMRKGDTKLKDQCQYMIRRPTEIFLKVGEKPPKDAAEGKNDLSQEELLKIPVYIPHRPKKDPRELKILDPACGSGHFLLYCFDLLLTIYEEAYADPDLDPALKKDYPTLDALKRDVPRLILGHNLHGIDIDLRASQIAALALWLRCQRAYQEMGLKKDRPKITRSNFVCAEPMPGEEQMLKEFVSQLEPKVLGQVVEIVFDKMRLAGEAGSLLKIEEEIWDAIREAKRQYAMGGISIQRTLFDKPTEPVVKVFSVKDITEAQFFEGAEAQVIEALQSYAEKAQNSQRLQCRLFSEDAVRGFAFVDLCQKRYDVVLMNPPFGEASHATSALFRTLYPNWNDNLLCAFIERAWQLLAQNGKTGTIYDRTALIKSTYEAFRRNHLIPDWRLEACADLGWDVLDANVEVTTSALSRGMSHSKGTFIDVRTTPSDKKETSIVSAISSLTCGSLNSNTSYEDPSIFDTFPNAVIGYDFPVFLRNAFASFPSLKDSGIQAYTGHQLKAERHFRLWWEVSMSVPPVFLSRMFNGAGYSPYSTSLRDCAIAPCNLEALPKETSTVLRNKSMHYLGGVCFGKRGDFFCSHILPPQHIFTVEGQSFPLADEDVALELLGLLNTPLVRYSLNRFCGQHKYSGYVNLMPYCTLLGSNDIRKAVLSVLNAFNRVRSFDETQSLFVVSVNGTSLLDLASAIASGIEAAAKASKECEDLCHSVSLECYKVPVDERAALEHFRSNEPKPEQPIEDADAKTGCRWFAAHGVLSQALGHVFGRYDLRFAVRKKELQSTEAPSPFAPLPNCSPGMLQDATGQPLTATPDEYPLSIEWSGILVDDTDHPSDVVRRIRDVLGVIYKNGDNAIEQQACDILCVDGLREYISRSGKGGFWDDHISRYSKSRRKAPIYWLLQSSKKNYALWLYYHRLDKDLLFMALVNYVEPKIRLETSRLESLRSQKAAAGESGKEAKRFAKDVERQDDFLSELRDFEDKLRKVANLNLEPDLNDGVVLNIAPLWELVPWKEAKKYWDELLEGQYEWSSIGKQLRQKGLVK